MSNQRKIRMLEKCIYKIKLITQSSKNLETGGLIYGRMNPDWVKIYDVSGPGEKAQSSEYSISFDLNYIAEYTFQKISEDYYILGTWHSHPSDTSLNASLIDISTMIKFSKKYNFFYPPIFIIVGWNSGDLNYQLYEVIDNKVRLIKLSEGRFIIE
ncbi:hypothetical protein [Exiguobacterium sp. s95]|uniref:hypothetical protein n=1 Tax=Exiguobacterium sp. s95 TaxID=2751211 RepID=UPI001BEC010E|nr:hypothetical protein [Exiguobacterium sp. s95]